MIDTYIVNAKKENYFTLKRKNQNKYWLLETINQQLKANFYNNPEISKLLETEIKKLENGVTTPFNAAKRLLNQ